MFMFSFLVPPSVLSVFMSHSLYIRGRMFFQGGGDCISTLFNKFPNLSYCKLVTLRLVNNVQLIGIFHTGNSFLGAGTNDI